MRFGRDRSFEQQFQWEVDRWVFRYRHKGEPVEVSPAERDRLVERHEARMLFGGRLLKLGFVAIAALCFAFPRNGALVAIFAYGSILIFVPLFTRWAYADVTSHLRKRPTIGMRLGIIGRMNRHAQAQSWPRLLGGFAYLALIAAMTLFGESKGPFGAGYLLLYAAIGALLAWMIVVKWAVGERQRIEHDKIDAMRRARRLR